MAPSDAASSATKPCVPPMRDLGDMLTPARRNSRTKAMPSPMAIESPEAQSCTSSPAEVFDMAAEDDDCCDNIKHLPDSQDASPTASNMGMSQLDCCSEEDASTAAASSTRARDVHHTVSEQVDAWDMEDWDSPASIMQHSNSICGAAGSFDEKQQEIADAVRTELQVDLEAVVNHAIDQMRSWVSAEIACARESFDKAAKDIHEKSLHEDSEVKKVRSALEEQMGMIRELKQNSFFEELKQDLDEQMRKLHRLEETIAAPAEAPLGPGASGAVVEARRVADERRWRLKMDGLQDGLDKQVESTKLLESKCCNFTERLSTHDSDIHKCTKSSQKADAQLASAEEERRSLQDSLRKLGERMETLDKRSKDALQQVTEHSTTLQTNALSAERFSAALARDQEERRELEANMEKQASRVDAMGKQTWLMSDQMSTQGAEIQGSMESLQSLRSQCGIVEKELSSVQTRVRGHADSIKVLRATHDEQESSLVEGIEALKQLEIQVTMSEKEFASSLSTHGKQLETLEDAASELRSASFSHNERLQASGDAIKQLDKQMADSETAQAAFRDAVQVLEQDVSKAETERLAELQVVCDKVEAHEVAIGCLVEKLEEKADWKMLSEALATRDGRITDITSKFAALEDDLARSDALEEQAVKLNVLAKEICRVEKELTEGLEAKATMTEVDKTYENLQTWVDGTREALGDWLSNSLQQFQTAIEGQSKTSEKHEEWFRHVSRWIEQVRVREQGLTHVILHMIEESPPEMLKLMEDALTVPRLPSFDLQG